MLFIEEFGQLACCRLSPAVLLCPSVKVYAAMRKVLNLSGSEFCSHVVASGLALGPIKTA